MRGHHFYSAQDGSTIRYALKPAAYGEMSIRLYTDAGCIIEYTADLKTNDVLRIMVCDGYLDQEDQGGNDRNGNMITDWMCSINNTDYGSWYEKYVQHNGGQDMGPDSARNIVWSLGNYLSSWNAAFDVYKGCAIGRLGLICVRPNDFLSNALTLLFCSSSAMPTL